MQTRKKVHFFMLLLFTHFPPQLTVTCAWSLFARSSFCAPVYVPWPPSVAGPAAWRTRQHLPSSSLRASSCGLCGLSCAAAQLVSQGAGSWGPWSEPSCLSKQSQWIRGLGVRLLVCQNARCETSCLSKVTVNRGLGVRLVRQHWTVAVEEWASMSVKMVNTVNRGLGNSHFACQHGEQ